MNGGMVSGLVVSCGARGWVGLCVVLWMSGWGELKEWC